MNSGALPRVLISALLVLFCWSGTGCSMDPEARKQRLLAAGNKYFDQGKYTEASIIYRRAIQQDRRFGEAYYRLGLTYLKLGQPQQAAAALRRAVELQPKNADAYEQLIDLYLAAYLANPDQQKALLAELQNYVAQLEQQVPGSAAVRQARGIVALAQKDYQTAIVELKAAVEQDPANVKAQVALAEALVASGQWPEAESRARQFIQQHPDQPLMYDFLYLQYVLRRQYDQAEAILRQKCASNPKELAYRLQLVRHYWATGSQDQARSELETLLQQHQQFPGVFQAASEFYARLGRYDEALQVLDRGIQTQPKQSAELRRAKAEVLAAAGRTAEAEQLLAQLLRENSEDWLALAIRGALRLKQGTTQQDWASARADLERAVAHLGDNPFVHHNLAEAYRLTGRWEDAIREYQEVVRLAPGYLPARYGLALAYLARQDYGRALATTEEILKANPQDLRASLLRAQALIRSGNTDQAAALLEQAVKQHPEAREPALQLALVRLQQKRLDEAEKIFRQLAQAPNPDPRSILGLAEVASSKGHVDQALALLQKQAEAQPDNPIYRLALARQLASAGKVKEAIREYEAIVGQQPDNVAARMELGILYARQRDWSSAEKHLQRAAQLAPKNPEPLVSLAMVAEQRKDWAQARNYYEKVLAIQPDHTVALNNLAYLLAERSEQLERAQSLAEQARSRAPKDPRIADTLAWVYIKRNLVDDAIRILQDVVRQYPNVAAWRYHLGLAFYQKGDRERARQELRRALESNPSPEEKAEIEKLLRELGAQPGARVGSR